MIAACSPADYNYDETLSTLRYAARAKAIKNKPKVNEDPKDALLKQYEDEIRKLKEMLESMNKGQPTAQNPMVSLQQLGHQEGIRLDLESSFGKDKSKEETVDDLIQKLNARGTKVRIVNDEAGDKENKPKEEKVTKKNEHLEVLQKE